MAETVEALRGEPLTIRVEDVELNGVAWGSVMSYSPTAQARVAEDAPVAATFTVSYDAPDLVLELDADEMAELDRPLYFWDVRFVDPDTDEPFYWPERGEDRHRLIVSGPITKPVAP